MNTKRVFASSVVIGFGLVASTWFWGGGFKTVHGTAYTSFMICGAPTAACPANLSGSGSAKAVATSDDTGESSWDTGGYFGGDCGSESGTEIGTGTYGSKNTILINASQTYADVQAFRSATEPAAGERGSFTQVGTCKAYQRTSNGKWVSYTSGTPANNDTWCTGSSEATCFAAQVGSERQVAFYDWDAS